MASCRCGSLPKFTPKIDSEGFVVDVSYCFPNDILGVARSKEPRGNVGRINLASLDEICACARKSSYYSPLWNCRIYTLIRFSGPEVVILAEKIYTLIGIWPAA